MYICIYIKQENFIGTTRPKKKVKKSPNNSVSNGSTTTVSISFLCFSSELKKKHIRNFCIERKADKPWIYQLLINSLNDVDLDSLLSTSLWIVLFLLLIFNGIHIPFI